MSLLLDLCRQSIFFDSVGGVAACLAAIGRDPDAAVARVKNRLHPTATSASSAGFRNVAVNLRLATAEAAELGVEGHVCEIQLLLLQMAAIKVGELENREIGGQTEKRIVLVAGTNTMISACFYLGSASGEPRGPPAAKPSESEEAQFASDVEPISEVSLPSQPSKSAARVSRLSKPILTNSSLGDPFCCAERRGPRQVHCLPQPAGRVTARSMRSRTLMSSYH